MVAEEHTTPEESSEPSENLLLARDTLNHWLERLGLDKTWHVHLELVENNTLGEAMNGAPAEATWDSSWPYRAGYVKLGVNVFNIPDRDAMIYELNNTLLHEALHGFIIDHYEGPV